jgi:streptogramin lyase
MKKIILLAIITLALGACRKNNVSPSSNQDTPPDISYPSPTLHVGQTISMSPKNRGGEVPATLYGQVTTFAGGTYVPTGYVNGNGAAASFNQPQQMTQDIKGNLYVADSQDNAIRKISPDGTVTTFAGSLAGTNGYKDAADTSARFDYPDGITIDAAGNLFVSDYNNKAIRKITPAGAVSTFYTTNTLFGPAGLCFDHSGNLIVAAQDANQVVRISPAGVLTSIAGSADGTSGYVNGMGASAQFYFPEDVKVNSAGDIYVADYVNNDIRSISPTGVVTTLAGTPAQPDAQQNPNQFFAPTGIAIGAGGVVYVANIGGAQVKRLMPDGTVSLVAGSITSETGDVDGVGSGARFYDPIYIYSDNNGTAYVSDWVLQKIKKIVLTGYTFKGNLPPGLTFDYRTGVISGTPTTKTGVVNYTITAFNKYGFSVANFTIKVD